MLRIFTKGLSIQNRKGGFYYDTVRLYRIQLYVLQR